MKSFEYLGKTITWDDTVSDMHRVYMVEDNVCMSFSEAISYIEEEIK